MRTIQPGQRTALLLLAAAALLFVAPVFLPLMAQVRPAGDADGAGARKDERATTAPRADDDATRLWFAFGVGGAGTKLTCDLCTATRDVGPSFAASAGFHAKPRLRIGLEASRWAYSDDDVTERVHTLGLVAHLVPDAARGFYLMGGAGWTGYRAGEFSYDAPRLTVGLGWDVPFTGDWVVGNFVALDAAAFSPIKNDDVPVMRNVGLSTVRLGVQLQRR